MLALLPALLAAVQSPVLIIPGDGSNQLEAKLNKPSVPHFYCSKTSDWYRLWLNTADLLAATSCWADNIQLIVNATTGYATDAPGVTTRVPYWGTTLGFEELDPSIPLHGTAAFYQMVEQLTAAGYERNATLSGAPYDFRYTPDSVPSYGAALKALVEELAARANGSKVTLVSHSMGGLQTLYFLRQQTVAWKSKFVAQWVSISAPFAGAAKEARLFASGDSEGLPVSAAAVRDEQRSYETNHWLFPTPGAGSPWSGFVLAKTRTANYTADDYAAYFADVGYPVGSVVHKRVTGLLPHPENGPGVPVLCMYSTGVDTPLSFDYGEGDWAQDPTVTMGDGDGTVNVRSLRVCEEWNATQAEPVRVLTYSGVTHSDMLKDTRVLQELLSTVQQSGQGA